MGKSGLMRGINWAIQNKPGGDAFRSTWGGDTSSILICEGGSIVERGKAGKTKNYYKYTLNGVEEPLTGFGGGAPPDEVNQIINMGEFNQQFQMDTPFLLSNEYSSGKVASLMNKAADLEIIDSSRTYIDSKQKHVKSKINETKALIEEKEEDLKELSFIDGAEGELFVLENLEHEVNDLQSKIKTIKDSISTIEENEEDQKQYITILGFSDDVKACGKLLIDLESYQVRQYKLTKLINALESNKTKASAYKKTIKAEKEVTRLQKVDGDCVKLASKIKKLSAYINDLESCSDELASNTKAMNELQEKFDKLMPDVCPLCGAE